MQYLKNVWYAAGWSADIGRTPLSRKIIEQPVVLYRTEAGEAVALADMCPHRFSPLSMGSLVGDEIRCLYHGLRFDKSGVCTHNPHGDVIPPGAVVRNYPLVERYGMAWIWMGDADKADADRIPDFSMLDSDDRYSYTRGLTISMPLNYELITDNLMDLSHVAFTHATTLGNDTLVPGETAVRHEGDAIWCDRLGRDGEPPKIFVDSGACPADQRIDFWLDIRWHAPASFYLDIGVVPTGRPRDEGALFCSGQILTPAGPNQTYYFIKNFRNYMMGNDEATRAIEEGLVYAFETEDEPMIARVQENMAEREFWSLRPVILPCDSGAVRVRRFREKMLRDEQDGTAEQPASVAAE
ncbi:MAG: aromatic ring-hydroxylating dioxygenase subunit alpha [Sphingobium sp.]|uniref:aromatic ring-hydroxylating dioxygenase subunit alpha n=1 Tax=Sphingobium sp. TaxID=1912891 RepID=UPI002E1B015D